MPIWAEAPAEIETLAIAPPTSATPEPQSPTDSSLPCGVKSVGQETVAAFAESQSAAARGLEAISDEIAGLARAGIGIAADAATQMLGVKTISDVYRINALFADKSFNSLLDGSAKLSRLGFNLAADASRPVLTQFGEGWIRAIYFTL